MLALNLGAQEGIRWHLRAIRADGSYYGEIRFNSPDPHLRIATSVSGEISQTDCERLDELVREIQHEIQPTSSEPQFARLFERLSATDLNQLRTLLVYHRGDEENWKAATAFVELAQIIERYLQKDYARIGQAEQSAIPSASKREARDI